MLQEKTKEFSYILKDDYDKKVKINGDEIETYSKDKLDDLYPQNDAPIIGETFEKKKRDKDKDIGRIELADKRLYVSQPDTHSKIFRKQAAFVETEGGKLIALLRIRLLPILLIGVLPAVWRCCSALMPMKMTPTSIRRRLIFSISPVRCIKRKSPWRVLR